MAAEPPDFRLGEMVSFMVTRDRLSAKSLVFLNLEFQKPANVGTWATPLRTLKPKSRLIGIELLNHASSPCSLRKGLVGSSDPWSSVIR